MQVQTRERNLRTHQSRRRKQRSQIRQILLEKAYQALEPEEIEEDEFLDEDDDEVRT